MHQQAGEPFGVKGSRELLIEKTHLRHENKLFTQSIMNNSFQKTDHTLWFYTQFIIIGLTLGVNGLIPLLLTKV